MMQDATTATSGGPRARVARPLHRFVVALGAVAGLAFGASAQVTPERLYYGIDRPIPVSIDVPAGVNGDAEVRLLEPNSARVIARAAVSEGRADLAALFPQLWAAGARGSTPTLSYAQLFVGDEPVGPAVVLQPMVSPQVAQPGGQGVSWQRVGNTYSGIRAYVDKHVVLETSAGDIVIRLRPDEAPNMAWNFRHLVEGGFYTDIIFHRIINDRPGRPPFVIQVGDPTGTGMGGPGYMVDLEPSSLRHDFGVLSMARSNMPDSNGSQVFLCLSREGTSFLDGNYTAFGEAVDGAQVILDIAAVPVGAQDRPTGEPPRIVRAYLVEAPPYPSRPAKLERPSAAPQRRD